ncbi:energy transducer TonB [Hymenobacter terricola]|uniref:energy transducer TonB n=1 Tax=Hymenobacter terricola TaxID=2819236 RepID=UPI001B3098DB|nr:energy transducer TonB [Hymenobacter terricola]
MKNMRWLLLVFLGGFGPTALAQQIIPPLKREFLDSTFHVLPSEVGARYRRETEYTDSVGGTLRDYFLNGKLQSICTYDNVQKNIAHGSFDNWYPNGQQKWHQEFVHGAKQGESRLYYASGQLKRHETYVADKVTKGECYRADGTAVPFFEFLVMPVYSEGDGSKQAIVAAVSRRVQYPPEALRYSQTGQVLVTFVVSKKGKVTDVRVTKAVTPPLDAAAVQAVKQLGRFTPGKYDGEIAAISFTVPITFRIQ